MGRVQYGSPHGTVLLASDESAERKRDLLWCYNLLALVIGWCVMVGIGLASLWVPASIVVSRFLYVFALTLAAAVIVLMAVGCRPKRPPEPNTKDEVSVVGAFAQERVGWSGYQQYSGKMEATALTDNQRGYKTGMDSNARTMHESTVAAERGVKPIIKANETSRQGFFRSLDFATLLSGVAASIGAGLFVIGLLNGKPSNIGAGVGVIGISGILVFMMIRSAAPVMPWLVGGLGVTVLCGAAWFVFDRIQARREKKKREKELVLEHVATKELSERQDAMEQHLPDFVKPALPKLSSTTEKLVQAAKNGLAETDVKAAAVETVAAAKATVEAADAAALP